MLEISGLCAWWGFAQVLFDVSVQVGAGELVVLQGLNGAGKSTLLQAIAGIGPRARGSVRYQGLDVLRSAPHVRARAGLAALAEVAHAVVSRDDADRVAGEVLPQPLELGRHGCVIHVIHRCPRRAAPAGPGLWLTTALCRAGR